MAVSSRSIQEDQAMQTPIKESNGARFGCGFVFGLVFAGLGSASAGIFGAYPIVAGVFIVALFFGLAAMHFGDSFWRWFSNWFGWFR